MKEIEINVKNIISRELSKKYSSGWMIKGIPKGIYTRVKSTADDKNYEMVSSGDIEQEADAWDFVTLKDCKQIILYGNHWSEIFEPLSTRPGEEKIAGGREAKTDWLLKCDSILNKLRLPTASYSVSTGDYELIRSIFNWLAKFK